MTAGISASVVAAGPEVTLRAVPGLEKTTRLPHQTRGGGSRPRRAPRPTRARTPAARRHPAASPPPCAMSGRPPPLPPNLAHSAFTSAPHPRRRRRVPGCRHHERRRSPAKSTATPPVAFAGRRHQRLQRRGIVAAATTDTTTCSAPTPSALGVRQRTAFVGRSPHAAFLTCGASLLAACSRAMASRQLVGKHRQRPDRAGHGVAEPAVSRQRPTAADELDPRATLVALPAAHRDDADLAGPRHVRAAARRHVEALHLDHSDATAPRGWLAERQARRFLVRDEADADRRDPPR